MVGKRPVAPPIIAADSPLLSLPFDHFERYSLTQRLVEMLLGRAGERPALRILDVGGHLSSLKHFLPDDFIVLADRQRPPEFTYRPAVPFRCDDYTLASGGDLPFADASFDLVTAHDTLEHVPEAYRARFVSDLLRVSRRFVILDGPVYHPETAGAERRLAKFWEEALLWKQHPLEQHLELGLPPAESIRRLLEERQVAFITIPNGNIVRWLAAMAVKHYFVALPHSDHLQDVIDRTYNSLLSSTDFGGTCYREAFVIAKHPGDNRLLTDVEAVFKRLQRGHAAAAQIDALDSLFDALTDHARCMRQHLIDDANAIRELNAALAQERSSLAQKNSQLAEQAAVLARREAEFHGLEAEFNRLEAEITSIQTSSGYRLLQFYRRGVRWAFPPRSLRSVPYRGLRRVLKRLLDSGKG